LDKVTPGIASDETLLYGVEVKFYSNKVVVDKDFQTSVKGLRAVGDGASVTRGLQQASANGISVARSILKKRFGEEERWNLRSSRGRKAREILSSAGRRALCCTYFTEEFCELYRLDSRMKDEIDSWPEGMTYCLACSEKGPRLFFRKSQNQLQKAESPDSEILRYGHALSAAWTGLLRC
jgi:hypothetical protein